MNKTIVYFLRSPEGGIRKHVVDLIKGIRSKDTGIMLITNEREGDAIYFKQIDELKSQGLKVINVMIKKNPGLHDLKNIFRLYIKLRPLKSVIFHGHGAKGGLYARILAFFLGTSAVYTPHGGSLHQNFGPFFNFIYRVMEKILLRLSSLIIFESRYTGEQFSKFIGQPKKGLLIYNGMQIIDPIPRNFFPNDSINLACLGILRHLKGFDLAIEATARLTDLGYKVQLSIFGQGPERSSLELQAKKLGIEQRVHFIEQVLDPIQTMIPFDIILQPSRFESFGYVPIEAMSMGRLVIVSAVGGLREVVKHGLSGLIVPPDDTDALVDAIDLLFKDAELRNCLMVNAPIWVEDNFSLDKMVEKTITAYSELG